MAGETLLFLFAVIISAVLLFAMVFFIIMFSDLQSDYINPIDLCNKLNQFVLPEMFTHSFMFFLFLINGAITPIIINLPLVIYNANKIRTNEHMFDATEIFKTLSNNKRESFVKLAFYMVSFFYYLYRMITAALGDTA